MKIRGTLLSRLSGAEFTRTSFEGVIENIARGGLRALVDRSLPVNSKLRCELTPGDNDIGVPTLVGVCWSNQLPGQPRWQLGLQFLI